MKLVLNFVKEGLEVSSSSYPNMATVCHFTTYLALIQIENRIRSEIPSEVIE